MIGLLLGIVLISFLAYFCGTQVYGSDYNFSKFYLLPYNFSWAYYSTSPPWYSSLAQAEALPILIHAYHITGLEKYKDAADGIINSFFVEVKDGGITYKDKNGWWYELYADKGSKDPRVLNGMLWTLLAINQYETISMDPRAKFLFNQGIESLKSNIHLYDADNMSYYDNLRTPANFDYHMVHINLLKQLYNITGEKLFNDYSNKWYSMGMKKPPHISSPDIYLDNKYIPYVDYGIQNGTYIGIQRNPVTVDHIARDYYNKFIESEDAFFKGAFLNNANWLINNLEEIQIAR